MLEVIVGRVCGAIQNERGAKARGNGGRAWGVSGGLFMQGQARDMACEERKLLVLAQLISCRGPLAEVGI